MDFFLFDKKKGNTIWHSGESQFDKTIQFYDIVLLLTLHEYQVFNSIFYSQMRGEATADKEWIFESILLIKVLLFFQTIQSYFILESVTANCNHSAAAKSVQLRIFIEVYCLNTTTTTTTKQTNGEKI